MAQEQEAQIIIEPPRIRERLTQMVCTTLPADTIEHAEKYVTRLQKKARAKFGLSDLYREILEQTRAKFDVEHDLLPAEKESGTEPKKIGLRVSPGMLDAYRSMAGRLQARKISDREISTTGLIRSVLIAGIRSLKSSP